MASSSLTGQGVFSSSYKAKVANAEASSDLISMSSFCRGETPITRKELPVGLVLGLPLWKCKLSLLPAEDTFWDFSGLRMTQQVVPNSIEYVLSFLPSCNYDNLI